MATVTSIRLLMWVAGVLRFHAIVAMLTVTCVGVLQGVFGVESSSSSKRAAVARSYYDQDPVRNGVGVDDQREHQPVREGTPGCGPIWTRTFLFRILPSSLAVDNHATSIARRCREGLDIYAWRGNDPRGPKRGTSSRDRAGHHLLTDFVCQG